PSGTTTRGMAKFSAAVNQVAPYLDSELNMTLDESIAPNDVLNAVATDLDTVIKVAQSEYASAPPVASLLPDGYARPPAPKEDYLAMDRDLSTSVTQDLRDVAGGKIDTTSEYWAPPKPTTDIVNDYGNPPPELFPD